MRKLIAVCIFSMFATPVVVHAKEINSGTLEIAGNTNARYGSKESWSDPKFKSNTLQRDANTALAFYVMKNTAIGVEVVYSDFNQDAGGVSSDTDGSSVSFGPLVGRAFSLTDRVNLKIEGVLLWSKQRIKTVVTDASQSGFGWKIGGKVSFHLNDNVSFDIKTDYKQLALKPSNSENTAEVRDLNTYVGITVYTDIKKLLSR